MPSPCAPTHGATWSASSTAAREAFAERGLDVGVEEIARRAGVGKATFFRRFPTKDALVLAVLEGFVEEIEAAADEAAHGGRPARRAARSS